jgi:hypothetical protein
MKVQATQLGYYQHKRRREGEIFDLVEIKGVDKEKNPITISPEAQFSKKWMKALDDAPKVSGKNKQNSKE